MTILELMADNSLPDAARVIGFHIAAHDGGEGVELRLDDVSRVLNGWPGPDKCRTALRVLRTAGYIESRPGGRAHGDVHVWLGDALSIGLEPHPNQNSIGLEPHPKSIALGSSPTLSVPSYPSSTSYEKNAGARFGLDPAAERAIADSGDVLEGCRGALTDYLRLRVEERFQYGYVQSVVGCIQGTDEWCWMTPGGGHVRDGRPPIVAGALNQLLQGDEIGAYFTGDPGDYKNLRSKIRYRVKSLQGAKRDARRTSGRDAEAPRGEAPEPPSHQGEFPEPAEYVT